MTDATRQFTRPVVVADAQAAATGAMIALIPTLTDATRLALSTEIDGAEPVDELHLTLLFLGEAADWSTSVREDLITNVVDDVSRFVGVVRANAFGAALWNPGGDSPAVVLEVGDVPDDQLDDYDRDLAQARDHVLDALAEVDTNVMPKQHSPWRPHVCLAYRRGTGLISDLQVVGESLTKLGPITFDVLRISFGQDDVDVPLNGATIGQEGGIEEES